MVPEGAGVVEGGELHRAATSLWGPGHLDFKSEWSELLHVGLVDPDQLDHAGVVLVVALRDGQRGRGGDAAGGECTAGWR
jgi:hypothetical protein